MFLTIFKSLVFPSLSSSSRVSLSHCKRTQHQTSSVVQSWTNFKKCSFFVVCADDAISVNRARGCSGSRSGSSGRSCRSCRSRRGRSGGCSCRSGSCRCGSRSSRSGCRLGTSPSGQTANDKQQKQKINKIKNKSKNKKFKSG